MFNWDYQIVAKFKFESRPDRALKNILWMSLAKGPNSALTFNVVLVLICGIIA